MSEKNEPAAMLAEATLWFRKNEKGAYEYNHVEDGHASADKPAPKTPNQSGWIRGNWIKEHAWLDDSFPPKVMRDPKAGAAETQPTAIVDE